MADDLDNASFRRGSTSLAAVAFTPYAPTVAVTYLHTKDGDERLVECIARMWDVEVRHVMPADDCHDMRADARVNRDGTRAVIISDSTGNVLASAESTADTMRWG